MVHKFEIVTKDNHHRVCLAGILTETEQQEINYFNIYRDGIKIVLEPVLHDMEE